MNPEIIRVLIRGATRGGMLSLLALGFTLIYGISGVVNLSHGSFFMAATYLFFVIGANVFLGSTTILTSIIALIASVIVVAVLGSIVYRVSVHPVLGDEVAVMVVTVCIALAFQEIFKLIFGFTPRPVRWPADSLLMKLINIWGVTLQYSEIIASSTSLIIFVILVFLIKRTKIGKAMRAVSQDREAAMLMGINTRRLYTLTMAASAMLAGIAGILIVTSTIAIASPFMWLSPLASSFAIVILGGLGSIKGSLIGGFIIGYAEMAVTVFVGGGITGIAPLIVMVAVLLLRPKGLFGKRIEMEA